ncbi:MAG: hypothetical protein SynsKO_05610 [Synoicihabitans sp.]
MRDRTLIVILCETRGFNLTFERFERNLLKVISGDLALCVADNEREDTSNPFYHAAKHIWRSKEYDDWGDAIESLRPDCHPDWRSLTRVPVQWLGSIKTANPHPGSGGIIYYFREFLRKSLRDSDVLKDYDRVMITRSDFLHEIPHVPLEYLDSQHLWVPDGEHYRGITDRHCICPTEHIEKFLSMGDIFTENPEELIAEMAGNNTWNPEQILKRHLNKTGLWDLVRYFPYTMYAVREASGHTTWSAGQFNKQVGAYVKYETEYQRARLARLLCGKSGWNRFKIRLFNLIHRPFDWCVNKLHFAKMRFS